MKKSFLLLLLLIGCFRLPAQTYYKWAGAIYNGFVNTPADKAIVTDANSNVYVTGTFTGNADFDISAGTAVFSSAGSTDIFIARYDSLGNYKWAKSIGSTGAEKGASIAIDSACNIYITGEFQNTVDFDPGIGVSNLTAPGTDIFLAKYDSLGNFIWAKSMVSNSSASSGYSLCFDHSGKLILAGKYAGIVDFDPGAGTSSMSVGGGFIAKYDTAGSYIWAKTIGNNMCVSVSTDQYDDVYVTGIFNGTADFDPDAGAVNLTAAGIDIFVAAYNSAGNYAWAFKIGNTATFDHDYPTSIVADSVGNVYVSGIFNSGNADFDPGPGTANLNGGFFSTDNSIYVAKYNSAGAYSWAFKTGLGGVFIGDGGFLRLAPNGDLYVTASHGSDVDLDPGTGTVNYTSQGSRDIFIARYAPGGSYIESFSIGGQYIERPYGIVPDNYGNIFLMANIASYMDMDPTTGIAMLDGGGGSGSMVIAKYGACVPAAITQHPVNDTTCPGGSVSFSAAATGDGLTYQWQCNNGSGFINVNDDGFYYTGAHTPQLNVMNTVGSQNGMLYQCVISGACSAPVAGNPASLVVLQLPALNSQAIGPMPVCRGSDTLLFVNASGSSLTYQWEYNYGSGYYTVFNGAHYSGATNDTLYITDAQYSLYNYRCKITGICGAFVYCNNVMVYINELPNVVAGASSNNVCVGSQLTLTGSGALTYTWSGGVIDGVPFIPVVSDTYTVTGTDWNNCTDTASVSVNINPLPVVVAGTSASSVCEGSVVTLGAIGNAITYTWSGGVSNGIPFIPSVTQIYIVTGTDANNCQNTDSILITVINLPDNTVTLNNNTLTANAVGIGYQWVDCNNSFQAIPGETGQSYTGPTGSYAVIVSDGSCTDTSQCQAISITGLQRIAPTQLFTSYPNPASDILIIELKSIPAETRIEIENTLGQVVYSASAPQLINQVRVSHWNRGVYFVKIKSGHQYFIQRVLIN